MLLQVRHHVKEKNRHLNRSKLMKPPRLNKGKSGFNWVNWVNKKVPQRNRLRIPQGRQDSQELKLACNKIKRLQTRKIWNLTFYETTKIKRTHIFTF